MNNRTLALNLAALAIGMLMLAYASVPLYRLFCEMTGFGGATKQGTLGAVKPIDREITITFNADIDQNLPWEFRPLQKSMKVRIGEQSLAFYEAKNLSDQPITGHAVYNVTPFKSGPYFVKIACFCFQEQRLEPGQHVNMPISFYIDPAIADDKNLAELKTITLSYTFFQLKK